LYELQAEIENRPQQRYDVGLLPTFSKESISLKTNDILFVKPSRESLISLPITSGTFDEFRVMRRKKSMKKKASRMETLKKEKVRIFREKLACT
jgi:hypothetical protein